MSIKHGRGCACTVCDPQQARVAAAREKYLAEQKRVAALPPGERPAILAKSAGARPLRRPPSDDTRRLAELLRDGKRFAEAAQIIEAEKAQRKDPS